MRTTLFTLALTMLTLVQSGCATGFRATGPRGGGVSAGAGVGPAGAPVVIQENGYFPPPPPSPPPPESFR